MEASNIGCWNPWQRFDAPKIGCGGPKNGPKCSKMAWKQSYGSLQGPIFGPKLPKCPFLGNKCIFCLKIMFFRHIFNFFTPWLLEIQTKTVMRVSTALHRVHQVVSKLALDVNQPPKQPKWTVGLMFSTNFKTFSYIIMAGETVFWLSFIYRALRHWETWILLTYYVINILKWTKRRTLDKDG